ncbi:MAG: hypothetical protein QM667_01505 [Asticcacaulis sp.]
MGVGALLVGCASAPLRVAPDTLVGQTAAAVEASWGKPDSKTAGEGGAEVWAYKREINKAVPGGGVDRTEHSEELSTGSRLKVPGTTISKESRKLTCETKFTIVNGQVTAGVSEGEGCGK